MVRHFGGYWSILRTAMEELAQEVRGLTDIDIEELISRYLLEMARYERLASAVAEKLRRELRANEIKSLLSFRAKHPEDLREKLRNRSREKPELYSLTRLGANLNDVVTDLAGCRVVVYYQRDESLVAEVVKDTFVLAEDKSDAFNVFREPKRYCATHLLVRLPETGDEWLSVRDAICEIQISTVAAHLFNEIEHDFTYKEHGVQPSEEERVVLDSLFHATRAPDAFATRLHEVRAERHIEQGERALADAEELRTALERLAGTTLRGDWVRLYRTLHQLLQPVTVAGVLGLSADGKVTTILAHGKKLAIEATIAGTDDVTEFLLGLMPAYAKRLEEIVSGWRGPVTNLRRAIQMGAKFGKGRHTDHGGS